MRAAEIALGVLVLVGLFAALPLGMQAASGRRDLSVSVATPAPHELAASAAQKLAAPVVGPPELLPRLELSGAPDRGAPGLALRTWQVTYGHRWERQVTLPVLYGPFDPEGAPWPCSIAVRLAPSFFDGGKAGGMDVKAALDRAVRAQFPFDVFSIHFAPVASTALALRPAAGGLEVSGTVTLADAGALGDPTRFSIKGAIALGERDGDLDARLSNLQVTWGGRTRHDPLVELAGFFMDVDGRARSEAAQRIQAALGVLKLPKEPFAPFDDRPGDKVSIRLCSAPSSGPSGLVVNLRIQASLGEPRVDPQIPGPAHLDAPPRLDAVATGAADSAQVTAVISPAAVQQALYLLWQAGQLEKWGRRPEVVSALREKLQDRLAFDFKGLDVRLPPSVLAGDPRGGLGVRFADVSLGQLEGGRALVAHGDVEASARIEDGRVGLRGSLEDLRVNCAASPRSGRSGWALSPCFSDVVPVIRESGFTSDGLPLDMPIPDRLLRINLVLGTELRLRDLRAAMSGDQLRVAAFADLVDTTAANARKAASPPGPGNAR